MKTFNINERVSIKCHTYETRNSWGHKAVLYLDGSEVTNARIKYYNRTWESYEYQSICQEIVHKARKVLGKELVQECNLYLQSYKEGNQFGGIAAIAMLGDILCNNQKDQNEWKARMIKAGLGNSGLQMPSDWDSLDEDKKEERLNRVISELSK